MSSSESRAWKIRRATEADRDAAEALMARAFGHADPDFRRRWDWIFLRNTSGARMHYLVAEANGRLCGQYAAMPIRLQHDGRRVCALVSLHTATDPAFERQGIFTTLARQLYDEARGEAPIVYTFPNPASAPVFYSRLDFTELRPFPLLVRPFVGARHLAGASTRRLAMLAPLIDVAASVLSLRDRAQLLVGARRQPLRVSEFDTFGSWIDELWSTLAPELGTCAVRDAAYLTWRFCASPFRYRRYCVLRGDVPLGFAVTTTTSVRGGRLGYLMELMVPKEERAAAAFLLAYVQRELRGEGAIAMYALATRRHPQRGAMLRSGLVPVPRRLAASFSVGVLRNGPGAAPNRLFHVDDWYLTGADLDYV